MRVLLSLLLAAGALAILASAPGAEASGAFAVSPPEITRLADALAPGSVFETNLVVRNTLQEDLVLHAAPYGPSPWVTLPEGAMALPRGARLELPVRVHVPADARPGDHTIPLPLRATFAQGPRAGSGVDLSMELVPLLRVRVTGDAVVPPLPGLLGAEATSRVGAPVAFRLLLEPGALPEAPRVTVRLADAAGGTLFEELVDAPLQRGPSGSVVAGNTTTHLPRAGTYVLHLTLHSGSTLLGAREVPLDVALTGVRSGRALALAVAPGATDGAPSRVSATFVNQGDLPLGSVRLVTEVYQGGRLVTTLHSAARGLAPGEVGEFETPFIPEGAGNYRIASRFQYDDAETPTLQDFLHLPDAAPAAGDPLPVPPSGPAWTPRLGPALLGVAIGLFLLGFASLRRDLKGRGTRRG